MKPVAAHLTLKQERSPLMHLVHTITEPRYRLAFILVMLLPTGGYMLMPFGTAYIVNNVGLALHRAAHHLSGHRTVHRLRGPAGRQGQRQFRQVQHLLLRQPV